MTVTQFCDSINKPKRVQSTLEAKFFVVENLKFIPNSLASPGNSETLATELFYLDFFFLLVSLTIKLFCILFIMLETINRFDLDWQVGFL